MNNRIFLINTDDVKAVSQINCNVDDTVVSTAIRDAQNVYLREIIGDALLGSIQEKVEDGSIDSEENAAYLDLLDNYISDYLAYRANVEICIPISFKIRNIGVAQDNDVNITASQLETVKELRSYYLTQAVDKANRMICFLLENRRAFPELKDCGCSNGCKAPNLNKQVNTDLYLK